MLTEQQLLLDLDPRVTAQEELRIRLNLELQGHMALDIPVSKKNRRHWASIYEAQHQDPVYKPRDLSAERQAGADLALAFRADEQLARQIRSREVRGLSVGPLDFEP